MIIDIKFIVKLIIQIIMAIAPLKFVVKYDPPLIGNALNTGLLYKKNKKDKKKYIYNILINGLINLQDP